MHFAKKRFARFVYFFILKKAGKDSIYSSNGTSTNIEGSVNIMSGLPESCKIKGQSFIWTLLDRNQRYCKGRITNGNIVDDDTPVSDVLEEIFRVINAIGSCVVSDSFSDDGEDQSGYGPGKYAL